MRKLPDHYYDSRCYWAHMLTLRCNGACPYCILDGRGKCVKTPEMSGKEVLAFWNGLWHERGKTLSIIGGEPTLHPDIIEIVAGLENYHITITTNCRGPFYRDGDGPKKLRKHPTSSLRVNTTFHPHHIGPEEYIDMVAAFRAAGHYVDQIGCVDYPGVEEKYGSELAKVRAALPLKMVPYLGFIHEGKAHAAAKPERIWPNEDYHNDAPARLCGLGNIDAYRHICGQEEPMTAECHHPYKSLIMGPSGKYYHCHYKLYYDLEAVSQLPELKTVPREPMTCNWYGFCNWCDVPRVGCVKNKTARKLEV